MIVSEESEPVPALNSLEFRQRVLSWPGEKPIASIARDLHISDLCLRWCIDQVDIDDGQKPGLCKDGRAELV